MRSQYSLPYMHHVAMAATAAVPCSDSLLPTHCGLSWLNIHTSSIMSK